MILGLPWWAWLGILVIGLVLVALGAARVWRASMRREFLEYLRREAPNVEVVREYDRELEIRTEGEGRGRLRLDRLFAEGAKLSADDASGREALFAQFTTMVRDGGSSLALDAERDRQRVLPRLVNERFLQRLRADVKDRSLPALPSGVEGLSIVFVLDSETSVAYVTDQHLGELRLTLSEALPLATKNLSRSFSQDVVRRALTDRSVNVVKSGDSFDAARILLVPECLNEGEEVAALIPDRDTLVVTAVPADHDWSSLRKLAKASDGEPLWTEPLLVTTTGISPVQ